MAGAGHQRAHANGLPRHRSLRSLDPRLGHHPRGSAAEGHLALDERFAIYDRIVTEPDHRRRGLGQAVMRALQAIAHARGRHAGVLVATPDGRALYEAIGWRLHGPWATAVIPGPDATP